MIQTQKIQGADWQVSTMGRGPNVIFLHSFGGSSLSWELVVDRLSLEVRCIIPDLRGSGSSDGPPGGYDVASRACDVLEMIDRSDISSYYIVGHSMGGKVALELATMSPPGLQGLILLAPSPPSPEPMKESDRLDMLASHRDREYLGSLVDKITALPLPDFLREAAIEDYIRTSDFAWRSWLLHGSREDFTDRVSKISVPVTIAVGQTDPVIPEEFLQDYVLPLLPGATLESIPWCGHLSPLEAPDAVGQIIRRSVGEWSRPRARLL